MASFEGTLRPHQITSVEWCLKKERGGGVLCLDMGLGKTIVSIATVISNPVKTLVIVPLTIVSQWEAEFQQFSKGLTVVVYHGTDRKKAVKNMEDADVVITTYNTFVSDLKNENTIQYDSFERIIVDEAHKMKNRKSMMHKSFIELFPDVNNKILLTGTPICNSEQDLISLFLLLNREPFDDFEEWKNMTKSDKLETLQYLRKEYMLVMEMEKTMPGIIPNLDIEDHVVEFKLAPGQKKIYNRLMRMPTTGRGAMLQKISALRLCVNDNKLITIDDNVTSELAEKISVITDIVEKVPENEKIIIFSSWLKMLNILNEVLPEESFLFHGGLKKDEKDFIISEFKKEETPRILLITIRSGSVGLNLNVANHCIIVEPYWNSSEQNQAIKRVHRIGQTKEVKVHQIQISNTVENWVKKLQETKTKIANKILHDQGKDNEIADCFAEKQDMFNKFVNVQIEDQVAVVA